MRRAPANSACRLSLSISRLLRLLSLRLTILHVLPLSSGGIGHQSRVESLGELALVRCGERSRTVGRRFNFELYQLCAKWPFESQ